MKAYGYLRVSSSGQVEKDGPQRQKESILAFCTYHMLHLSAEEFFEAGVSGTTEDRPEFLRILEVAVSGDCIVVERLDRLARDLMVQEFLLKECRTRGVRLFATDQGLVDLAQNDTDPTRKLIRQVLGALAEWEKSALVLKLRKARDRRRKETGRCEGPPPYGEANPYEKDVVKIIWDLHGNGLTTRQIRKMLQSLKLFPRGGEGKEWGRQTIVKIIKRKERMKN